MKRMSLFLLFFVDSAITLATPIGRTTIRHLLAQSPLVLKGTVVGISEAGMLHPVWSFNMPGLKAMRAAVDCSYVLKGTSVTSRVEVLFPYVAPDSPFATLQQGTTYILFLATDVHGLKVADPVTGVLPVLPGVKPEPIADPETMLKVEMERSLTCSDPTVVVKALMTLSEVGDNVSLQKLDGLTESTNESVHIAACAAALALGKWDKAREVVRFLDRRSRPTGEIALSGTETGFDVGALMMILGRVFAPEAMPVYLDLLCETKNPRVLKELLSAPCITASELSAPIVSKFLDSEDDDVAYAAYRSLMTMKGAAYNARHAFITQKTNITADLKSWSASRFTNWVERLVAQSDMVALVKVESIDFIGKPIKTEEDQANFDVIMYGRLATLKLIEVYSSNVPALSDNVYIFQEGAVRGLDQARFENGQEYVVFLKACSPPSLVANGVETSPSLPPGPYYSVVEERKGCVPKHDTNTFLKLDIYLRAKTKPLAPTNYECGVR